VDLIPLEGACVRRICATIPSKQMILRFGRRYFASHVVSRFKMVIISYLISSFAEDLYH
jgi:hypothetical protein